MGTRVRLPLVAGLLVLFGMTAPTVLRADVCGSISNNLVLNCGFESGESDWTVIHAPVGSFIGVFPTIPVHSGSEALLIGAWAGQNDYIYQNLPTWPGEKVAITFYLAVDPNTWPTAGEFVANWNGTNIFTLTGTGGVSSFDTYTAYSFIETATSDSTQLEFGGNNPPSNYYLDDVSAVDLPEPSGAMLLGSGLLGLAGLAKRRFLS